MITPAQSVHRSNSNEVGGYKLPTSLELEPHHQMQISVILRTTVF